MVAMRGVSRCLSRFTALVAAPVVQMRTPANASGDALIVQRLQVDQSSSDVAGRSMNAANAWCVACPSAPRAICGVPAAGHALGTLAEW
jgi:hypothetical protein